MSGRRPLVTSRCAVVREALAESPLECPFCERPRKANEGRGRKWQTCGSDECRRLHNNALSAQWHEAHGDRRSRFASHLTWHCGCGRIMESNRGNHRCALSGEAWVVQVLTPRRSP